MSDREEALDFIYKGWRDGRQNRRDVRTERGQNTMASRRQFMEGMNQQGRSGSRGGPPSSKTNVASSPPSSDVGTETSPTSVGNFTDDVMTPDDESTPINEAVATPPSLNPEPPMDPRTAMGLLSDGGPNKTTYDLNAPKPSKANDVAPTDWMNQYQNRRESRKGLWEC